MARFFLIGSQITEIEIKELLLRRYHSLNFIKDMTLDEFAEFLCLAITNEKKDKIYLQYLSMLPLLMRTGKYMTFEKFYDEFTGANIDLRSADEILKEAEEIQRKQNGS